MYFITSSCQSSTISQLNEFMSLKTNRPLNSCHRPLKSELSPAAYGKVFLVRKKGGFDHGKLFAMKVLKKGTILQKQKTTEYTLTERQVKLQLGRYSNFHLVTSRLTSSVSNFEISWNRVLVSLVLVWTHSCCTHTILISIAYCWKGFCLPCRNFVSLFRFRMINNVTWLWGEVQLNDQWFAQSNYVIFTMKGVLPPLILYTRKFRCSL